MGLLDTILDEVIRTGKAPSRVDMEALTGKRASEQMLEALRGMRRTDMAVPAVIAGRTAEAHRAARRIFDTMIRQGQNPDEARTTASRWVKENLGEDVQWPEAPGFDPGTFGGGARTEVPAGQRVQFPRFLG